LHTSVGPVVTAVCPDDTLATNFFELSSGISPIEDHAAARLSTAAQRIFACGPTLRDDRRATGLGSDGREARLGARLRALRGELVLTTAEVFEAISTPTRAR